MKQSPVEFCTLMGERKHWTLKRPIVHRDCSVATSCAAKQSMMTSSAVSCAALVTVMHLSASFVCGKRVSKYACAGGSHLSYCRCSTTTSAGERTSRRRSGGPSRRASSRLKSFSPSAAATSILIVHPCGRVIVAADAKVVSASSWRTVT